MRKSILAAVAAFALGPALVWADAFQQPTTPPCGVIPAPDSLMGSAGNAAPCAPAADASRPSSTQAVAAQTDGTGAWSVTWAKPFGSVSPYVNVQPINVADTQPYICNVASSTATGATGKCWKTNLNTLPAVAINLLSLVLNPTSAAANIPVRVVARDTTQ